MREPVVRLGPLALLLAVISICLSILAILTFSTAGADLRLAERYAETIHERYSLEMQGQEALAALDTASPEDWESLGWEQSLDGGFRTELSANGSSLQIEIKPEENGSFRIVEWIQEKSWEQDDRIANLWQGF